MTLTATIDTQPLADTNGFAVREQPAVPKKSKSALGIIDCDVHHQFDKPEVLFPYLPRHYIEWIKDFGAMMPGLGYTNMPGSGARVDLWDGKDINPATVPDGGDHRSSGSICDRHCHPHRRPVRRGRASRR